MSKIEHFTLNLRTGGKTQLLEITDELRRLVRSSDIKHGACSVFVPHTTAGVTINENADPDVRSDIIKALSDMVSEEIGYAHREGNSPAHVKSSLMGSAQEIFIRDSELLLGTWQGVFLCEFDGPRSRKVHVMLKG